MSIVCAKGARFRYRKPRKKRGGWDSRSTGFKSYDEYLKSELWASIRDAKLAKSPKCECCGEKSTQVHHFSYFRDVILGLCEQKLVSVCRDCHLKIEFTGGKKNSLKDSQRKLIDMLRAVGKRPRIRELRSYYKSDGSTKPRKAPGNRTARNSKEEAARREREGIAREEERNRRLAAVHAAYRAKRDAQLRSEMK